MYVFDIFKKKDFGDIIQKFSIVFVILSYIGEAIWLLLSLINFVKYREAYDFVYLESEYTILAQQGLNGIIFSLVCITASTVFFLILYGFGQIVSDVHKLRNR